MRRAAFWPLVMLALMARLGLGGPPVPGGQDAGFAGRIAQAAILCDAYGQPPDDGDHHHDRHLPQALADTTAWLADGGDDGVRPVGPALFAAIALLTPVRMPWRFAPIRGPPVRALSGLYAQGPPRPI